MNINYTLHGIHFEWDSQKASTNLQKHRVSFETACEVFLDPFVQVVNEEVVEAEVREGCYWDDGRLAFNIRGLCFSARSGQNNIGEISDKNREKAV